MTKVLVSKVEGEQVRRDSAKWTSIVILNQCCSTIL